MMVFLADVGVKVNRKILLCKRSGGDGENRGSEDPPLQKREGGDGETATTTHLHDEGPSLCRSFGYADVFVGGAVVEEIAISLWTSTAVRPFHWNNSFVFSFN
jgi:hypothetical protein